MCRKLFYEAFIWIIELYSLHTHIHMYMLTDRKSVYMALKLSSTFLPYTLTHIAHMHFHFDIIYIFYIIIIFFPSFTFASVYCFYFVFVMPIATCHRCFHEFICKFSVFGLHFMNFENV